MLGRYGGSDGANPLRNVCSRVTRSLRTVAPFSRGPPDIADFPLYRLFSATKNSLRGLVDGFKTEPALRDEAVLFVIAAPLGLVVAPSAVWYVAMIGVILVLLAIEFLNTAIEKLADHVTREQHNDIRRIKDFGSAAVFCGLCLTGLVWIAAVAVRLGLL
jgi:diacylglycerol kinase (ATP)